MSAPSIIRVYVCEECGYWRRDKGDGAHLVSRPEDGSPEVRHPLREAHYALAGVEARS